MIFERKKIFILLFATVFLLNMAYSFFYRIEPVVDAAAYNRIGLNIVQGNGYIERIENKNHPERDNAIARVGPGYQFFLASVYSLFGHHIEIVWFLHALLRVATVYFIYLIARCVFTEKGEMIGLLAGAFYGFSPDLVLIQAMLLTETLGIFFLVLSVWLAFMYIQREEGLKTTLLSFGIASTAAFMTRTTSLLVFLAFFIFVLFWRKNFVDAAILLIIPVIIITPWAMRNYDVYNKIILTNAVGGYDLWVGNNPDAKGGFEKTPEIQLLRDQLHITEISPIGFQRYFEFIRSHPLQFIEKQFRKTTMYFSLIRPTGFWFFLNDKPFQQITTIGASALWTGVLLVGGIAGAALLFIKRNDILSRILLIFAVLQPIAVIPVIVESRYRYPLFPFLALFAAYLAVMYVFGSDKRRILKVLAYSLIILLVLTVVDFGYNSDLVFERLGRYF